MTPVMDIDDTLEQLRSVEIDGSDVPALHQVTAWTRRTRAWLDALDAKCAARLADLTPPPGTPGPAVPDAQDLFSSSATSQSTARRRATRAENLCQTPALGAMLEEGLITSDYITAVADVAANLDQPLRRDFYALDDEMASSAKTMPPAAFRRWLGRQAQQLEDDAGINKLDRQKRRTKLSRRPGHDGSWKFSGEFDPESGEAVNAAIDAQIERIRRRMKDNGELIPLRNDQLAAQALTELVLNSGERVVGEVDLIVLIDLATLQNGLHKHSTCETNRGALLPPETVRRMACSANIIPTVLGSNGVVLDQGRSSRVANRQQRRAMRAMYPTCGWHGCDTPFDWCQLHHITPWAQHGPTNMDNLVPLCNRHHHAVHEGGWNIQLLANRTLRITMPNGKHHADAPLQTTFPNPGHTNTQPPAPAPPEPRPPGTQACDNRLDPDNARATRRRSPKPRDPAGHPRPHNHPNTKSPHQATPLHLPRLPHQLLDN